MTSTPPDDLRAPRQTAPTVPLALTLLLLLLVALGATLTTPWETTGGGPSPTLPPPVPIETVSPPPTTPSTPETTEISPTVKVVTLVLTCLVATALAAYLLYRGVRRLRQAELPRRTRPQTARSAGEELGDGTVTTVPDMRTGVDEAIGRLQGATTSEDAIIAAWLALEESAEAAGAPRTAAQTPTELTVAVLDTTPAPPETVGKLLRLYHLARFTSTPLTEKHVAEAQACLDDLARTLHPHPHAAPHAAPHGTDAP